MTSPVMPAKFTLALAEACRARAVTLRASAGDPADNRNGDHITGVETITARSSAMRSYWRSAATARCWPADRRQAADLPREGYSLTLPITDPEAAPAHFGVDEANLVAFARLGDRCA